MNDRPGEDGVLGGQTDLGKERTGLLTLKLPIFLVRHSNPQLLGWLAAKTESYTFSGALPSANKPFSLRCLGGC